MLMVLVKSSSNHILQAVVNIVLLDKALTRCHTLLLPAPTSTMDPQRTFTIKFAATFHRFDHSSLGSTYYLYLRLMQFVYDLI
jgi:hypothetical protein